MHILYCLLYYILFCFNGCEESSKDREKGRLGPNVTLCLLPFSRRARGTGTTIHHHRVSTTYQPEKLFNKPARGDARARGTTPHVMHSGVPCYEPSSPQKSSGRSKRPSHGRRPPPPRSAPTKHLASPHQTQCSPIRPSGDDHRLPLPSLFKHQHTTTKHRATHQPTAITSHVHYSSDL